MTKRRCAYCGQREGHGHSVRCGVTRHGLDPCYEEDPADVTAERDRYRQALERCQRELDRREETLRDTSRLLSRAGAALLDAEAQRDRLSARLDRLMSDEGLRAMDAVIGPIIDDDDMPCLDDYRRALAAALNQEERDA